MPDSLSQLASRLKAFVDKFRRHSHDGIETDKLIPARSLRGFPVVDTTPTDAVEEGTIRFINDSGTYKLAAYIDGDWRTFTSD